MFIKPFKLLLITLLSFSGLLLCLESFAKTRIDTLPLNWHLRDAAAGPYFGISLDKAYKLLQGRKPVTVTAGVIDSGVDTLHEDLQAVLWHNPKPDKHYPGSRYGWSYLGSVRGNVTKEQLEMVRMVRAYRSKGDTTGVQYKVLSADFEKQRKVAKNTVDGVGHFISLLDSIARHTGKAVPKLADLQAYTPKDPSERGVLAQAVHALQEKDDFAGYRNGAAAYRDHFKEQLDDDLNLAYDPRAVVGDHPEDMKERFYGCADVNAAEPMHGTHVAGIIAADRVNDRGMQGIADQVKMLAVRAVPSGDERDKDVANAIRYAVDHGSKVINMSFGKAYSPEKKVVDEAVAYAVRHDVLLIHAAGNEHLNIDSAANFPNRNYLKGGEAAAWIEVGASGPNRGRDLVAGFSNYGRQSVDLFAPGVDIYSTLPKGAYGRLSGTSMACPVVCGIAALIRSYFPKLSALQVKDILMRSVITDPVLMDKCRTGGVVNAEKAVELALQLSSGT